MADWLSREVAATQRQTKPLEPPMEWPFEDTPVAEDDMDRGFPLAAMPARIEEERPGVALAPFDRHLDDVDRRKWAEAYAVCPQYGADWRRVNALAGGGGPAVSGPLLFKGILQLGGRTLVPLGLRPLVTQTLHDRLGHPGELQLLQALQGMFDFAGQRGEVRSVVKACGVCALLKGNRLLKKHVNMTFPLPRARFAELCMDFAVLDPVKCVRPNGGYFDRLLVVVDRTSRFVVGIPCRRRDDANTTWGDLVERVFSLFGTPSVVISDNDVLFTSDVFSRHIREQGIAWRFTAPTHPQSNGLAERTIGSLKARLHLAEALHQDQTWLELLGPVLFQHNATPHSRIGVSPFELLFGFAPSIMPVGLMPGPAAPDVSLQGRRRRMEDAVKQAQGRYESAQERTKAGAKTSWLPRVGEFVSLYNRTPPVEGQFHPKFVGPFRVVEVGQAGALRLEGRGRWENVMNVKKFEAFVDSGDESNRFDDQLLTSSSSSSSSSPSSSDDMDDHDNGAESDVSWQPPAGAAAAGGPSRATGQDGHRRRLRRHRRYRVERT